MLLYCIHVGHIYYIILPDVNFFSKSSLMSLNFYQTSVLNWICRKEILLGYLETELTNNIKTTKYYGPSYCYTEKDWKS